MAERTHLTATFIGADRAGAVARITRDIFDLQGNLEGLEERVARGEFSMTLDASWEPDTFDVARVGETLRRAAADLSFELTLHTPQDGPPRMAVLVTKESHCLRALMDGCRAPQGSSHFISAQPVVVIGNRPDLKEQVEQAGIPFHYVRYDDRAAAEAQILEILKESRASFVVLARFMKILSPGFVWRWKNRIVNIHPSLLPAFPGANAYRQAYEKGVRVAGVTAHFVTPQLDEGPIIAQRAFSVELDEPLAAVVKKGQQAEAACLVEAVQVFLTKRLDVYWGRVHPAES